MPLNARAFLGIWHNLKPGYERDFDRWHTYEHMPERVGVPGFRVARRYMNRELKSHLCFTLYEGAHLETFRSPGYLARLNDPTEWSKRVGAGQTDFLRGAFEVDTTLGVGIGGALATFRMQFDAADRANTLRRVRHACLSAMELHGVTGTHLGSAKPEVTEVRTREMEIRGSSAAENALDAVVLVESIGMDELAAILGDVSRLLELEGVNAVEAEPYRLAYLIHA